MNVAMDAALWALLIAAAAFLSFVFFGGTAGILFSKRAPWEIRKRWVARSVVRTLIALAVAGVPLLLYSGLEDSPARLLVGVAILAAPLANWIPYNQYQKSFGAAVGNDDARKSKSDQSNPSGLPA